MELYDFKASDKEADNFAAQHADVVARLKKALLAYRDDIPGYQ